jgi:hypothetical protein
LLQLFALLRFKNFYTTNTKEGDIVLGAIVIVEIFIVFKAMQYDKLWSHFDISDPDLRID